MCTDDENDCNYYSDENSIKICFNTKQECQSNGYNFLRGKICLQECNDYKDGDTQSNTLINCYQDIESCAQDNLLYHTQSPKKCYRNTCPNDLYPKLLEGTENINEFIYCLNLNKKISKGFCKDTCDDDECYFIDNENIFI